MNSQVSIVKCPSYEPALVQDSLRRAVDLLGGISVFVKPGSKVLVKPNLLMAAEPDAGVTTHPEVIRAVIKLLKSIDCKIIVGDSPSVWGNQIEDVGEVYERTGAKRICIEEGVELVEFDKRRWRAKFPMAACLDECDFMVNLPKFKTHGLTILTAAVKNLFGLIVGTYKTELHKRYSRPDDFSKMLVDIYQQARPSLNIIDAITAMEGDGPGTSGKPRKTNLLLASSDAVALDSVLTKIMGQEPFSVATTKEAAHRGLGVADINAIALLGESLKNVTQKPFLLPTASMVNKLMQPVLNIAKHFIRYYPYADKNCIACGACVRACPEKIISMENSRISFKYAKCIACFCCQEVCPAAAIKVKKSLLAKMIGL